MASFFALFVQVSAILYASFTVSGSMINDKIKLVLDFIVSDGIAFGDYLNDSMTFFNEPPLMESNSVTFVTEDEDLSCPYQSDIIPFKEYDDAAKALKSKDDYFFFDLDKAKEIDYENGFPFAYKSNSKQNENKSEAAPEMIENFILNGNEIVPRDSIKDSTIIKPVRHSRFLRKRKEEREQGFWGSVLTLDFSPKSVTNVSTPKKATDVLADKKDDNDRHKAENEKNFSIYEVYGEYDDYSYLIDA